MKIIFICLTNRVKHKIIIEIIGWISVKVWRGEARWAKVNEIKVPLSRQVAALLQSTCNIFICSFIFYLFFFFFFCPGSWPFFCNLHTAFLCLPFPPDSILNGNEIWCIIYTKEDYGFIHPSFIAIWVWLGDQGNKRIKTRLGSSNVSTSNIVLQDERQQPKKSKLSFFLVFQQLSNFVLYYFSRAAAGSRVGKY